MVKVEADHVQANPVCLVGFLHSDRGDSMSNKCKRLHNI